MLGSGAGRDPHVVAAASAQLIAELGVVGRPERRHGAVAGRTMQPVMRFPSAARRLPPQPADSAPARSSPTVAKVSTSRWPSTSCRNSSWRYWAEGSQEITSVSMTSEPAAPPRRRPRDRPVRRRGADEQRRRPRPIPSLPRPWQDHPRCCAHRVLLVSGVHHCVCPADGDERQPPVRYTLASGARGAPAANRTT